MPLYDWVDQKTKKATLIQRTFDKYKEPPTEEEAVEQGLTKEEAKVAAWERHIGVGIQMLRGNNWSGKKGSW